jgi:hypothetical protein
VPGAGQARAPNGQVRETKHETRTATAAALTKVTDQHPTDPSDRLGGASEIDELVSGWRSRYRIGTHDGMGFDADK